MKLSDFQGKIVNLNFWATNAYVIVASAERKRRSVFRHEPIEIFLEIGPRGRIRILHEDEAATRVLNENGRGAGRDATARHDSANFLRDFIRAFARGADSERFAVHAEGRHFAWTLTAAPSFAIGDRAVLVATNVENRTFAFARRGNRC